MSFAPAPAPATTPRQTLAIVSLVLGVASLVLCWVPFLGLLGGIGALVVGILALTKAQSPGMSIAGLVTGGIAVLCGLAFTVALLVPSDAESDASTPAAEASSSTPSAPSASAADPRSELESVQEQVEASGEAARKASERMGELIDENQQKMRGLYERICDTYQACPSPDDPKVKYTAKYCALITSVNKVSSGGEQLKIARALSRFDDMQAGYWKLIADFIETAPAGDYPKDVASLFTIMVIDAYQVCPS